MGSEGGGDGFAMKLKIQHLEEKLAFLAGGTDGGELASILMEKEQELEKKNKKLKQFEKQILQLAEGGKKLDAKRREAIHAYEVIKTRTKALEIELERQLESSDVLCRTAAEKTSALAAAHCSNSRLESDLNLLKESSAAEVAAARSECAELITELERNLVVGEERLRRIDQLEGTCMEREKEIESLQSSKRDMANRSRTAKLGLEESLSKEKERCQSMERKIGDMMNEIRSLKQESSAEGVLKKTIEDLVKDIEMKSGEILQLGEVQKEKVAKISMLQTDLQQSKAEIAQLKEKNTAMGSSYESRMEDCLEQMRGFNKASEAISTELENEIGILSVKLKGLEQENESLKKQNKVLTKEVGGLQRKKEVEAKMEKRWAERMEREMAEMRQELVRYKRLTAEAAVTRQENAELKVSVV